jgi:hypothetical protein
MTTTTGRRLVAPVGSDTHASGCPDTGSVSKVPRSGGGCGKEAFESLGTLQVRRALEELVVLEPSELLALPPVPQVLGALETDDSSAISESSFEAAGSLERSESLARLAVYAAVRAPGDTGFGGSDCAAERAGARAKLTSRGRPWAQAPDASGNATVSAVPARCSQRQRNATDIPRTVYD